MNSTSTDYADILFKTIFGNQAHEHTKFNVERMAWLLASISSANLFMKEFPKVTNYTDSSGVLRAALKLCSTPGLFLEFGVATGRTISLIASMTEEFVHGFDSFEGIPEDWSHFQKAGRYSMGGKIPENLPDNVQLHVGYFDQTLPTFIAEQAAHQNIRFMHIDSDLYSSAKTVLHLLSSRIVPGTVIVFDDFFNYPNWENGESKAWYEFVAYRHVEFEYIGWASKGSTVGVRVKKIMTL